MSFADDYNKFEKMQGWAINDLRKATIKGTANFLVAMGIFNYIEMLGGFYYPNATNKSKERFNHAFTNFFPQPYLDVFKRLEGITKKGAYDCLRCGMAHEYFIKSYSTKNTSIEIEYIIQGVNENDEATYSGNITSYECGIELLSLVKDKYQLRIYNPRFIHDLNGAFETLKSYVRSSIGNYRNNFIERCREIHIENFN